MHFATAGNADFLRGQDKPKQAKHAETVARIEAAALRERSALDWNEKIDRHALHAEFAQRHRKVDDVVGRFAHADDSTRAGLHAGLGHSLDGGLAIVERMGCDDFTRE